MEVIDPALAELDELTRQSSLREVFFTDVGGKLSTYAGPLMALAAGNLAGLPLAAQGAMALISPTASALTTMRAKRRALLSNRFLFLHSLEKKIHKAQG